MSKNIKGITVEIGAETSGLDKALQGVNKETRDVQKELREVDKLLRFNPGNTELVAQKQKLLGDAVETTKEKLDKLKEAEKQVQEQFEKGEISEEQYRAFQREVVETESKLAHYQKTLKEVSDTTKEFAQKMEDTSKKLKDMGGKIEDTGKSLTTKLTVPLVAVGGVATKIGIDFEKAMSEVQAVTGATADELKELESAAREAGSTTDKSASEAAEALLYMGLAGWDVADSQKALMPILKLSSAANMDLGKTSDLVTDTMSVLGLKVNDLDGYLDVLAQTSRNSNTGVDQLGEAFLVVGGKLKGLGVDVNEGAAALGILADNGIKGSEAGRGLNAVITNLTTPTGAAKEAMEKLNISVFDGKGEFIGLENSMALVEEKTAGMTQEQQNMYKSMIAGKEHTKTLNALMDGLGGGFQDLKGKIDGADGSLDEMYTTATDNTLGAINNLKSAMEELALKVFDNLKPSIDSLVAVVQSVTDKFNALSPGAQENIVKMGMLVAAIGPVLLIVGKLTTIVGGAIGAVGKIAPLFKVAGTAIGAINAPVLIAVGAIAGIIAIGIALWKNWDTVKAKAGQLGSYLSTKFKQIGQFIMKPINAAKDSVGKAVDAIKGFFSNMKLRIPKISLPKLPKFTLTGKFGFKPPSVPKLGIKWNAEGAIFNKPYIFGNQGVNKPALSVSND